jgi:phosphoserine aminotransferase
MNDAAMEQEFMELCKQENMVGVKGHRLSGGFRISMYNALPLTSVVAITDVMKHFANKKG